MDRDEPRFAQASKQMMETGDFVDIRFQDEVRYKKPIGIHWMQVASVRAADALGIEGARTTIAVYRIPSLWARSRPCCSPIGRRSPSGGAGPPSWRPR
jgi:4-amino-4-deoxy-L-arabinose transferase-like glycosyltransferase